MATDESPFAIISQLAWSGIFTENKDRSNIDMRGFIANQRYRVDVGTTANDLTLTPYMETELMGAYANECNRFAMAAFESISGLQKETKFPRTSAWNVIRSYYAAFFAAHAILRLYRMSFTYLEQVHASKLFSVIGITEPSAKSPNKGNFHIRYNQENRSAIFKQYSNSHEHLWFVFINLIRELRGDVDKLAAISIEKIACLDALVKVERGLTFFGKNSDGGWLSSFRNSVNYRLSNGAWFPYEGGAIGEHLLETASVKWLRDSNYNDISDDSDELENLFNTTSTIVSMLRVLLSELIRKNGTVRPPFSTGSAKMLKIITKK